MAPNNHITKYPSLRDSVLKDTESWVQGKVIDDQTEGLWRVHDGLYDFSSFVDAHPGGSDWLKLTKGTDITEAFECHHISAYPEKLLSQYFIKKAPKERLSPFTFREDGFYRTLKRRIRAKLPSIDKKSAVLKSRMVIDLLTMGTFTFAIMASSAWNLWVFKYVCILGASACLTLTTIAAHNFFHQKDNWRMWLFNLSGMSARDWRVRHALSHHIYTNTFHDHEISDLEPFIYHLPSPEKSFVVRYLSWIYLFVIICFYFDISVLRRVVLMVQKRPNYAVKQDLLMFLIPAMMYLGSGRLLHSFLIWRVIFHLSSFLFGAIGITAAHHHPDIYHEGDEPPKDRDWGVHQLAALMDRISVNKSFFQILTTFGDHGLHHLFPTLDHAMLGPLHDVLDQTCKEFGTELRMTTWTDLAFGQFKNIARTEPKKRS